MIYKVVKYYIISMMIFIRNYGSFNLANNSDFESQYFRLRGLPKNGKQLPMVQMGFAKPVQTAVLVHYWVLKFK